MRYKPFIIAILINLVVGGGLIFSIFYSFTRVKSLHEQINTETAQNQVLQERYQELKNAEANISSENIELVANLLPDKNPGFLASNQVRQLASQYDLTFENYSVNTFGATKNGLYELNINLEAVGNYYNLVNFVDELKLKAPILILLSVEIEAQPTSSRAEVVLTSYWAGYPQVLPSINEPIKNLDEQELKILAQIGNYQLPSFTYDNILPVTQTQERANPFFLDFEYEDFLLNQGNKILETESEEIDLGITEAELELESLNDEL